MVMASPSTAGPSSGQARAGQMAAPQWRQFTFFDTEEVKDAEDLGSSPRVLAVRGRRTSYYDQLR